MSLGQWQTVIQGMGFQCVRDSGNEFFTFQAEGYKVAVFAGKDKSDFQLYAGFTDVLPSLETVNDWNRSHRFGRAYVDKDGCATLVLDVDLDPGVTRTPYGPVKPTFSRPKTQLLSSSAFLEANNRSPRYDYTTLRSSSTGFC